MTKHQRILNTISSIRSSHSQMVNIFTQGSCANFYQILKSIYPNSIPYYDANHIITNIDGKYYDITGQIFNINNKYLPYTSYYGKRRSSRKLTMMIKSSNEFPLKIKD